MRRAVNNVPQNNEQSNRGYSGFLTQRKCSCGSTSKLSGTCENCEKGKLAGIQAKLRIGAANDVYEQEADRVADQVMTRSQTLSIASSPIKIQRFSGGSSSSSDGSVSSSVGSVLSSGGRPLIPSVRQDMEQRFGHEFSNVRIHTGSRAENSARDIDAHAYTSGNNVVFGAGRYSPDSNNGKRLLAHELTHVVQQNSGFGRYTIQRDLAIEPTVANPAETVLTSANMRKAIRLNSVFFTDAVEISIIRDVVGVSKVPSVIDEDFINAIIRYQTSNVLTPDGMIGPSTAALLEAEITAESDALGEAATGTPMRRVSCRLHLRAMTSRTRGLATHQGFVGPENNPRGAVTVRVGDRQGGLNNAISLEYTGENSNSVNWLQFINMQMFATPPAGARVFNTGAVGTTGGPVTWSNAAATNWFVDAVPGGSPLYNVSGGINTRAASRRLAMFDQPGGPSGLPVAQAFTSLGGLAAGATTVTMRMGFDAYVIRANRARYHVNWTATTTYNITSATSSAISFRQGAAGSRRSLRAVHRTALLAEYPGSTIT